jgi:hypothetical protein
MYTTVQLQTENVQDCTSTKQMHTLFNYNEANVHESTTTTQKYTRLYNCDEENVQDCTTTMQRMYKRQ